MARCLSCAQGTSVLRSCSHTFALVVNLASLLVSQLLPQGHTKRISQKRRTYFLRMLGKSSMTIPGRYSVSESKTSATTLNGDEILCPLFFGHSTTTAIFNSSATTAPTLEFSGN